MIKVLIFVYSCYLAVQSQSLFAYVFPFGNEAKNDGAANALSSGNSAVFYNPAVMIPGSVVEMNYIMAEQSYEHPDFDPVTVDVRTPTLNLGFASALCDRMTVGFSVLPTAMGEIEVPGLPRRIVGEYQSLIVKNKSKVIESAVGLKLKVDEHFDIGLGILYSYIEQKTRAWTVNSPKLLYRIQSKNHFYRAIFGSRFTFEDFELGLSFSPEQKKAFSGTQVSAVSDEETASTVVGYEPEVIRVSVSSMYEYVTFRAYVNYLFYSKGESVYSEGVTSEAQYADLHDVLERGLSVSTNFIRSFDFFMSLALLPTPWGGGIYDPNYEERQRYGADFGLDNNVTRRVVSVGLNKELSGSSYVSASLWQSRGKRTVGYEGDKPGVYQGEVNVFSFSYSRKY